MSKSSMVSEPKQSTVAELTDREMKLIIAALPDQPNPRRRKLLAIIVKEWITTQLPELLAQTEVLEEFASRREQAHKLAKAARNLSDLLEEPDAELWRAIVTAIMLEAEVPPYQRAGVERRFDTEREFLRDLAVAAEKAFVRGRGRPRNIVARQAIIDLAEIFQYAAGRPATRQVDRITGEELGPFHHFCAAIWPVAFASDDGLPAALRNYQDEKKRARHWLDLNPTFLDSLQRRHPEWGIFEDQQVD